MWNAIFRMDGSFLSLERICRYYWPSYVKMCAYVYTLFELHVHVICCKFTYHFSASIFSAFGSLDQSHLFRMVAMTAL